MSGPEALSPLPHQQRLAALQDSLGERGVDVLLVTNPTNVRYLSGFTGSAGTLAVRADAATLITDGRYTSQASQQIASGGAAVDVHIDPAGAMSIDASIGAGDAVGFEPEHLSWGQVDRWRTTHDGARFVAVADSVESLRLVKDDAEVERIAAAADIADRAFAHVLEMLGERRTEREVGLELDATIRRLGASGNSFETIVASGPNAALPHARPTDRVIQSDELVVMDFGAVVDGYCSDMTRTQSYNAPSDRAAEMLDVVLSAQAAGVATVAAGATVAAVDTACRDLIADHGFGDFFTHGTGHGVGLDIHEGPRVSARAGDTLCAGHVVTVEPGIYLDADCGARIEDTVVVTESGCRTLTRAPKIAVLH